MMDASAATSDGLPPVPKTGDVIGDRFEICALLGEGGMGQVFRARDRERGRDVALKLLIPRYLGRPEREARLCREAELMQRVGRRPGLVEMSEAGRLGPHGWPYLVMEIVEGESLWGRIAFGGALPPNVAVRIARQIAAAVAALHRVGVVHRDVTPMNVLVEGNHAVLIDLSHAGDFGTPQAAVGRTGRLTGPHEVPGTHYYMSREQARAEPAHPSMDVYAFGVSLVHMLTGVAPSGLPREGFIALAKRGMVEAPVVDLRVHPDVPRELAELADECTSMDPAKRPSMDDVVARIDALLLTMQPQRRAPRKVYPVGGVAPLDAGQERSTTLQEPLETISEPRRWKAMLVTGGLLVAITGVLWLIFGRSPPAEVRPEPEPSEQPEIHVATDAGAFMPNEPRASPEPQPQPEAPRRDADEQTTPEEPPEARPESTADRDEPERSRSKRPGRAVSPCVDPEPEAAQALVEKSWNEVLELTSKPRCWMSEDLRWSYRAMALYGLGRHEQCLRAASHSTSRNAQRAGAMCREALAKEADEP
jgi:serine/threonine protein kinase